MQPTRIVGAALLTIGLLVLGGCQPGEQGEPGVQPPPQQQQPRPFPDRERDVTPQREFERPREPRREQPPPPQGHQAQAWQASVQG
jgi:hypothetical protein